MHTQRNLNAVVSYNSGWFWFVTNNTGFFVYIRGDNAFVCKCHSLFFMHRCAPCTPPFFLLGNGGSCFWAALISINIVIHRSSIVVRRCMSLCQTYHDMKWWRYLGNSHTHTLTRNLHPPSQTFYLGGFKFRKEAEFPHVVFCIILFQYTLLRHKERCQLIWVLTCIYNAAWPM